MVIGSLRVRLLLRQARTLKDKRQVVQSIKDRLRDAFNVSVSEVDDQDQRQLCTLGIALVGNEVYAVRTTLEKILEGLRRHPIAELTEHKLEV